MALESQDETAILDAVKQVVNNCITSENKDDINDWPIFDLEMMFLHLRARSISEKVEPTFRCNHIVDGATCGNVMKLSIDLLNIKPVKGEGHSQLIHITPEVGVKMKYPKLGSINTVNKLDASVATFAFLLDNIDYVFDKDSVYEPKDVTQDEMVKFFESMNKQQLDKITAFFETMPKLKYVTDTKCSKCGFEHHIEMEGLQSFFV